MNKSELQELINNINNLLFSGEEKIQLYISLLKQCVEKLQTLQNEDKSPMLDAWLSMGLQEIRKELNEKFGNGFENLSSDKQKSELMYSRSTVTIALTNILMHI
jgi:hypothetical protein